MESIIIIALVGVLLFIQAMHYRAHIDDLRDTIEHQCKMRKYEEERANALSDALFKHHTRPRRDTKQVN